MEYMDITVQKLSPTFTDITNICYTGLRIASETTSISDFYPVPIHGVPPIYIYIPLIPVAPIQSSPNLIRSHYYTLLS